MSNIIGKFTQSEWDTMQMLRASLAWYKTQNNYQDFIAAVIQEAALLREYYGKRAA